MWGTEDLSHETAEVLSHYSVPLNRGKQTQTKSPFLLTDFKSEGAGEDRLEEVQSP